MELVCAGLQLQQDCAASSGSTLRGSPADLDVHLLHGFHPDVLNEALQTGSGVHAVHQHVLRLVLRSTDVTDPIATAGRRHVRVDETRNVSPNARGVDVQRQVFQRTGGHQCTDACGLGFQEHVVGIDLYHLGHASNQHLDVDLCHLPRGHVQAGTAQFLETTLFKVQGIIADGQCSDAVDTRVIRLSCVAYASFYVRRSYAHIGNHRAGLVRDGTADCSFIDLRAERAAKE